MSRRPNARFLAALASVLMLGAPFTADAGTGPRTTVAIAPPASAPGQVMATASEGSVLLPWGAVGDATSYLIVRGTGGVWDASPLARVITPKFRDTTVTNGTTYSYRIAAANKGGNGPFSNEVTATPIAAPAGLVAVAGDTQVTLTWTASAGATSYTLYRGATSTTSTMLAIAPGLTSTSFLDMGLTNGTVYYYRVRASAGSTLSAFSAPVHAKPLPPPPANAPASVTATPGNMFVSLSWSPVERAVGYRIFRSIAGVWESTPFASTTKTSYKNTGLTNGTVYAYRIAGYNTGGNGPLSPAVDAVPVAPPTAPTGLTGEAGDGEVTLRWTPSAGATSYAIYRGTSSSKKAKLTTPVVAPLFVDTGLANGTRYFYQVTAVNAGGESPRSNEVFADPEGAPLEADPETVAAFRLLRQATWGPRPGDVEALKAMGADTFLSTQLSAPPSTYPSTLLTMPVEAVQEHFMSLALTGPDQVRQRMAWTLHKIWVVSVVEVPSTTAIVTYQRLLMEGAFGNYRDLMRNITLNPAMGRYLNMLNNRSQAVTGTPANENYARELMQLFTLGLTTLNSNGTPVVDAAGKPVPTYTEDDVKALARILTGWTFGDGDPSVPPTRLARENYGVPMEAVEKYHDHTAKHFLGADFPPNQTAQMDLDQALDVVFAHPNVGPFISRQLIQQFVTSNPSPGYVAAVAAVFGGAGGSRGDLAATIRAVLTNPEAGVTTASSGKLSEPTIFVVSTLRALNAAVTDHPFMSDHTDDMGQKVFFPPSVFSYYSPGFRVRGTTSPTGPLAGPEFQILTTVTALERANFIGALLGGYFGTDAAIDYTPFTSIAHDPGALVDYCNLLFMGGRMSAAERSAIIAAIRVSSASSREERARTAIYLTLTAAQAQVDR